MGGYLGEQLGDAHLLKDLGHASTCIRLMVSMYGLALKVNSKVCEGYLGEELGDAHLLEDLSNSGVQRQAQQGTRRQHPHLMQT